MNMKSNRIRLFTPAIALLLAAGFGLQAATGVMGGVTVLSTDGSDSYVLVGTPAALQINSSNPLTIEAWVYLNSLSTRDNFYSKNNSRGGPYTYMFGFYESGKITAYSGSAWMEPSPTVTISAGQWYHVAFSFDGTTLTYYLDGVAVGTSSFSFSNDTGHTIKLGGYSSSSDINGMLSDMRVWDHARSEAQIQDLMSRRLIGNEVGLLGYWRLDEGEGTTAYDSTANGSDGSLIGATWAASDLELSLFAVAQPLTGSIRFTNTNEVDVAFFPEIDGYTDFQITEYGAAPDPAPGAWTSTNTPPSMIVFTTPAMDTNVVITAWYTNLSEAVELISLNAEIFYTSAAPTSAALAELSRPIATGYTTVDLSGADLDDGSSGGTAGGAPLGIFNYLLSCAQDITPEDPYLVTLDDTGTYEVELRAINEAGNISANASTTEVSVVESATRAWSGAGDGNDWFDAANWDPAAVPGASSEVVIDGGASVLLTNSTAALSSFTLTNATLTASNWMTRVQADTVTIADGGTMTLPVPFAVDAMSNRIWIVCDTFVLASGGALNADGLGYNYQQGPGKAANVGSSGGPGAGHGGHGGAGMTLPGGITYGSITKPATAGSGSGKTTNKNGVPGGGIIRIEASGAVTLDGTISANGLDGEYHGFGRHSGGSAGGSIWISCETLSANGGSVRATGGQGQEVVYGSYKASGAGAGGRIAIHYDPVAQGAQPLPTLVLDTTPGPGNMNIVSAIAPTEPAVQTTSTKYFTISHEADWGSIYLSDASGVIQITETISDIGGHVSFGSGAAPTELNFLTVTNAFIGFETNTSITVQGAVNIEHGAGLIARKPLFLSVGGDWNNSGWTRLEDGSAVSVEGGLSIENEGRFFLADDAVLDVAGDLAVSGERANLVLRDMMATVTGDLSLADNAWFAPLGGATNGTGEAGLELTVLGELRLDSGSWIYPFAHPQNGGSPRLMLGSLHVPTGAGVNGDARGFDISTGPGAGVYGSLSPASGGGHGGRGGDSSSGKIGGGFYGNRHLPGTPGSGGGNSRSAAGGRGGSSIRLVVDGNSLLKGVLTARGGDGGTYSSREGGGGAGGGILVITDGLITDSNTVFHAIGGNASGTLDVSGAGSGGGGRIAIWYGLSAADRQPLLDDLENPSVQRRLIESESMEGFEGQFSFLNGTGGYEEGDPGTGIFVKMLHPPGTLILLR